MLGNRPVNDRAVTWNRNPWPTPPERCPYDGDLERIMGFFKRLGAWECKCCHEIFPNKGDSVLGVCVDCWENCEDLDTHVDFKWARSEDVYDLYARWMHRGNIQGLVRGVIRVTWESQMPQELQWLGLLFGWVGEDALREAINRHGVRADRERTRYLFRAEDARWHPQFGIVTRPHSDTMTAGRRAQIIADLLEMIPHEKQNLPPDTHFVESPHDRQSP